MAIKLFSWAIRAQRDPQEAKESPARVPATSPPLFDQPAMERCRKQERSYNP